MSSASAPAGSANRGLAIALAVLGILAIILAVFLVSGAANSVHFLVGSMHKGHHEVRAGIAFVVGIVLLVLAWFAGRGH